MAEQAPRNAPLTVQEAAVRLRVADETVRRWLRAGRLAGVKLSKGRAGWRVNAESVEQQLAQ